MGPAQPLSSCFTTKKITDWSSDVLKCAGAHPEAGWPNKRRAHKLTRDWVKITSMLHANRPGEVRSPEDEDEDYDCQKEFRMWDWGVFHCSCETFPFSSTSVNKKRRNQIFSIIMKVPTVFYFFKLHCLGYKDEENEPLEFHLMNLSFGYVLCQLHSNIAGSNIWDQAVNHIRLHIV